MLSARAFWRARRSAGLASGLGPLALTAIAMSLLIFVNCFATRSMRAKIVCLRFSNARPTAGPYYFEGACATLQVLFGTDGDGRIWGDPGAGADEVDGQI